VSCGGPGHHRQAVTAAVEAVVSEIQTRTGYDLSGAPLFEAAFNVAEPKANHPRLMLMPFEKTETYRNVQNGANRWVWRASPGCGTQPHMGIR